MTAHRQVGHQIRIQNNFQLQCLATSDWRRWPRAATERRRRVSVGLRLLVVALVECEKVLQFPLERLEGGSAHRILVPALQHDFVKGGSAVWWTRHTIAMLHLAQHLGVCHACANSCIWKSVPEWLLWVCSTLTWIGNATVCNEFSEQNAETPHVRFDGELAVVGRLRCGPLDGEPGAHASLVLVFFD